MLQPFDAPRISGQCGVCNGWFDLLRNGLTCPHCSSFKRLKVAVNEENAEQPESKYLQTPYPHVPGHEDCDACRYEEGMAAEVAWLEQHIWNASENEDVHNLRTDV